MTTTAKPTVAWSGTVGFITEPSVYQRRSSLVGSGACPCHVKSPSIDLVCLGTLIVTSPCVLSNLALSTLRALMPLAALRGGGAHPSVGCVVEQLYLCNSVPSATPQSWHLLSSMFYLGIFARLDCDHWPPETAEIK